MASQLPLSPDRSGGWPAGPDREARQGRRTGSAALLLLPLLPLMLAACEKRAELEPPPRLAEAFTPPKPASTISVPVRFDLDRLQADINRLAPAALWSIDERTTCIPPARVSVCLRHERKCKGKECRGVPCKIGVERLRVSPPISCRIVGRVTRGAIRLSGKGSTIALAMPVHAEIQARDVGGVIRQETATGSALVRATVRLGIDGKWNPTAKVDLDYDWTDPPGIDFLGQRIRFARRADRALQKVIVDLERDLPRAFPKDVLRRDIAGAWHEAFTTIELNRERPPAWMRITPQGVGFEGYRISGRTLEARIAARAITETFVGDRPEPPSPTPLPPPLRDRPVGGLKFHIPVMADYRELEPVLKRALDKLASRPITLERIGPVTVAFGGVTIYPTTGGRLAVGIEASADVVRGPLSATRGKVWLTGLPYNEPGSEVVRVRDLHIYGQTDRAVVDLLAQLFLDDTVIATIQAALVQDFGRDYQKVVTAAREAIAERREKGFLLRAEIHQAEHGRVQVTGAGLYMPTEVTGTATISRLP